jgi:hypothetical protein
VKLFLPEPISIPLPVIPLPSAERVSVFAQREVRGMIGRGIGFLKSVAELMRGSE